MKMIKVKKIFKILDNKFNIKDLLLIFENDLMELIENNIKNVFNDLKIIIDRENNYSLNYNFYYNRLEKELKNTDKKLDNKKIEKIEYSKKLNTLYFEIRKKYLKYIVFTNNIVNIYNLNNNKLIFMGEKYLFIEFNIKDKEFYPLIPHNFLPDKEENYNNYKIEYLNSNFIILNNFHKKIFYIIELPLF